MSARGNMKEIIIVTISLGNDGAERVLTELATEWLNKGHLVTVIQTHANRYGCEYYLPEGINKIYIQVNYKNKILRILKESMELIKILRKHPNATALSFLSASSLILAIASIFTKNRVIFSERNDPSRVPVGKGQQLMRDLAFNFADCCVFQTEDAKKHFNKKIQSKGIIIPNPINGSLPEIYEGERKKIIVTACRLHPQKNLKMMIDAFQMLSEIYSDYKLVIYGQGILEQDIREYIRYKKMDDCVLLPGFEKNIIEKIADCTMFVSSSDYEGISNSMLEAMAMGLPVVVTDCPIGGARMMIQDNENGLLVPVGDTTKLFLAMKRIIEDNSLASRLSRNASKIRNAIPLSVIAERWLELM